MDPDVVTAVVGAIAAGALAGAKETATTAVQDAYAGLKGLLVRRQVDVAGLERRPESQAKQDSLWEDLVELDGTPAALDDEVIVAAQRMIDVVAEHDAAVADVVGVDLARVRAHFLRVHDVDSSGTGARLVDVDVTDGIDISGVRAGATSAGTSGGGGPGPQER